LGVAIHSLINKNKIIDISNKINVSINTIRKWKILYKNFIYTQSYLTQKLNNNKIHKSNKISYYFDTIKNYVKNNNGCSLEQIKVNAINNELSNSSICRVLKINNMSRKRIQNHVVCKNIDKINEDRVNYANNFSDSEFLNYISIDESSFCINDFKKYGYSQKSCQIKKTFKHKHNKERYSLLAAISNKQIVAHIIFKGSLDALGYVDFITKK